MTSQTLLVEPESKLPPKRRFNNTLNELSGKEWVQDTCSIWYQRGLGKDHRDTAFERQHPAPFAYLLIERLLRFFTKKGDSVLDPFSGVGSTLKACELLGRRGVGIELSKHWNDLAALRLKKEAAGGKGQNLILGDCREVLPTLPTSSFDFVVTSPPYWGILNKPTDHRAQERVDRHLETRYSDDIRDLANIEGYSEFLAALGEIFRDTARVLKPKGFAAVVVADFRHKSRYVPFHSDAYNLLDTAGLIPKGIIIYVKNAKQLYPYGYPFDFVPNIHHEYVLVFRKPNGDNNLGGSA
jgi:DNA modification methylase